MKKGTIISPEIAKEKILANGKHIFHCAFYKKDESLREMSCRLNVKKYLVHGGKRASTTAHIDKYITVFEMRGEASPVYRNINIETMVNLTIDHKLFIVDHETK